MLQLAALDCMFQLFLATSYQRRDHLPPVSFFASRSPSAIMSTSDVDPSPNAAGEKPTISRDSAICIRQAQVLWFCSLYGISVPCLLQLDHGIVPRVYASSTTLSTI